MLHLSRLEEGSANNSKCAFGPSYECPPRRAPIGASGNWNIPSMIDPTGAEGRPLMGVIDLPAVRGDRPALRHQNSSRCSRAAQHLCRQAHGEKRRRLRCSVHVRFPSALQLLTEENETDVPQRTSPRKLFSSGAQRCRAAFFIAAGVRATPKGRFFKWGIPIKPAESPCVLACYLRLSLHWHRDAASAPMLSLPPRPRRHPHP